MSDTSRVHEGRLAGQCQQQQPRRRRQVCCVATGSTEVCRQHRRHLLQNLGQDWSWCGGEHCWPEAGSSAYGSLRPCLLQHGTCPQLLLRRDRMPSNQQLLPQCAGAVSGHRQVAGGQLHGHGGNGTAARAVARGGAGRRPPQPQHRPEPRLLTTLPAGAGRQAEHLLLGWRAVCEWLRLRTAHAACKAGQLLLHNTCSRPSSNIRGHSAMAAVRSGCLCCRAHAGARSLRISSATSRVHWPRAAQLQVI